MKFRPFEQCVFFHRTGIFFNQFYVFRHQCHIHLILLVLYSEQAASILDVSVLTFTFFRSFTSNSLNSVSCYTTLNQVIDDFALVFLRFETLSLPGLTGILIESIPVKINNENSKCGTKTVECEDISRKSSCAFFF